MSDRASPNSARGQVPHPSFVTEDWLRDHGVDNPAALLAALRPEQQVMQPVGLRAVKATRLSFSRILMRRMMRERWAISLLERDIKADGSGFLLYGIVAGGHALHFAIATAPTGTEDRLGRFNETEFDFYGSLFDGPADLRHAREEAESMSKRLWQARTDNRSLGWTIANRSQRYFAHVVERLADGRQPDKEFLATGGGYIVRNAGWYGNGRQGSRSWLSLPPDHPLAAPFQVDMFALYLWRVAANDIVEGMAKALSPKAVPLDEETKRTLGIGNASGIGMICALVRWPAWLSTFNTLRELALAYAVTRRVPPDSDKPGQLVGLLRRAAQYYKEQPSSPVTEITDPKVLSAQLERMLVVAEEFDDYRTVRGQRPLYPWRAILDVAEGFESRELVEQIGSLLIEVEAEFADHLAAIYAAGMSVPRKIDARMRMDELRRIIEERYPWALAIDFTAPHAKAHFWYRSEENGEHRRGERLIDAGSENEIFVNVAEAVQHLHRDALAQPADMPVGVFLFEHPAHAHTVSRVQLARAMPYSEIRGNIVDRDFLPMDGIRFLLSTFGLEASHPHSTRWVRGVFLQGAPLPVDLTNGVDRDWLFPSFLQGAT